jgi:hypothetical protein
MKPKLPEDRTLENGHVYSAKRVKINGDCDSCGAFDTPDCEVLARWAPGEECFYHGFINWKRKR